MTSAPRTAPPDDPASGTPPTGTDAVWAAMRRSGIARGADDRWVGGVCSGVAARIGVDPLLVRAGAVVLGLAGGIGVVAYSVGWLLLPDRRGRIEAQQALAGDVSGSVVAALALLAAAVLAPAPWAWATGAPLVDGGDLGGLALVALLVVAAIVWLPRAGAGGPAEPAGTRDTTAPAPVPRAPRRRGPGALLTTLAGGAALAAAGAGWLVAESGGIPGDPQVLAGCAALAVLAVAVVGLGLAGRTDGTVGFLAVVVALLTLAATVVPSWTTTRLTGSPTWQPRTLAAAERGWSLGAGSAVLDLTALPVDRPGAPVEVPVRVGLGDLRVEVPNGADVTVRGRVAVGAVVGDRTRPGDGAGRPVVVDARVLVGEIEVVEVDR